MVNAGLVVLVSDQSDLNLHLIVHVLQHRRIRFVRLDPTIRTRNFDVEFNVGCDGVAVRDTLWDAGMTCYDLSDVRAVWSRGADYFGGRRTSPGTSENLVHYESLYAYQYLWWSLRDRVWVNAVASDGAARNRLIQCRVAADCGIRVPEQVVTTLGSELAAFGAGARPRIIKNISQGAARESGPTTIKTEYLRQEDLQGVVDQRLSAPVLLQDYIEKDHELRVVVVGTRVYAAAIDSANHAATALDSRLWEQAGLTYYRVKLREDEEARLVGINQRLGLAYSSMDLVRGVDGHLYFLETNPSGQWSFIEVLTGYPITERIVDLLMGEA